jgi:hypothetical protein
MLTMLSDYSESSCTTYPPNVASGMFPPSIGDRRAIMGSLARFFALFWGWADFEPKKWSGAAYKRVASGVFTSSIGEFFALFWGCADYNPKDWSSAPYKRASSDFPTTIRMR